jgi:hypothetical protein
MQGGEWRGESLVSDAHPGRTVDSASVVLKLVTPPRKIEKRHHRRTERVASLKVYTLSSVYSSGK